MIPLIMPEDEPIVATTVLLLSHVPPASVLDSAVGVPAQITLGVIAPGTASTVSTAKALHPFDGRVYVIVEVPGDTDVTTPFVPIVATEVVLLLHVPPAVVSVNVVPVPIQISNVPFIGPGPGFTVSALVCGGQFPVV
jgi:hypothetical protein